MTGNSFGQLFRITTCSESHGGALGVIIDGCPPGLAISETEIQQELDRRKPGQSAITTPRKEDDIIHLLSGVFEGKTTGTPILLLAYNSDMRQEDYQELKNVYRPSHADFTYLKKYGLRDFQELPCAGANTMILTLSRIKNTLKTNYAGGILSGISTGETIYFRVAFKPVSTINKPQQTVNLQHEPVTLKASGRHDPCVLPRAVPIVDAMSALVVMDHYLRHLARG